MLPEIETEEKEKEEVKMAGSMDIMDLFAQQIKEKMGVDNINEAKVQNIVAEEVKKYYIPRQVIVTNHLQKKVDVGISHAKFTDLLKLVEKRIDTFLVGQAGSGKTTLCGQVAKSLELDFYFIPVGLQTTKSDLLGYMDATGKYVPTHLRKAYENGGVFLLDEIDAGNPNVLTVINAMLANHHASFPDAIVPRHDNFIFIAAGNTYGLGGDIQYVGRNQLDAATLDRFVIMEINYDKALEAHMCDNDDWLKTVWKIRKVAKKLNEKIIVSPRASLKGAMMLESGFSKEEVKNMVIYKGINQEIVKRIEAEAARE
jgi:midasin (ATPase involved in ribosome maturation)